MASYAGIHIEHDDPEDCAEGITAYEKRRRKVVRLPAARVSIEAMMSGSAGFLGRLYAVGPAMDCWTEVLVSRDTWRLEGIADFLSGMLGRRVLVLGYQTTAGQVYYRLSEGGKCRRLLWYTTGEPVHDERGERLEFEKDHIERQRSSLSPDDLNEIGGWSEDARETMLLPGCGEFARGVGCPTFELRFWHLNHDRSRGIYIKSVSRWWPFP